MTTRQLTTVLIARATIASVLLGIPAVLVALAGNPLPTPAQWSGIVRLEPDWGNTVLLDNVLPCLAWLAWALFAYPLIGELLRHRTGHRVLPTGLVLRGQQQVAAALVAAALLSSSPAFAASTTATVAQAEQVREIHGGRLLVDFAALHAPARSAEVATSRTHAATSTVTRYEVLEGDTLWGIADRRLGDGTKYPAIVNASADIVQPDGRRLTDPDLILPGWHLDLPTTVPATPHTPPASAPAPTGSSPTTAAAPPTTATTPSRAPSADRSIGRQAETAPSDLGGGHAETVRPGDAGVVPVAIGGGAAAILAAGLFATLSKRRRRQRAERRIGERLPVPADGPAHDLEAQVRAVRDPDALASLHRALASLLTTSRQTSTPLPRLFAVRVDDTEITLYLHEPATLTTPFRPLFTDNSAWTAPRGAFTIPVEQHAVAPYPAFVTIGTDLDGGILLLDLEQQPHLGITSPEDTNSRGMLNAIAAELASVPWGEDIHLSLVGIPEHLALELDPYRIHRVAEVGTLIRGIRTHLEDRRAVLDAAGVPDARTARITLAEIESWAPFVVLIGSRPSPDEQTELDALVREHAATGLVVVTMYGAAAAAGQIMVTDTSASYHSSDPTLPALPFVPQLLDQRALEQILQIFTLAASPLRRRAPTTDPVESYAEELLAPAEPTDDALDAADAHAESLPGRLPTLSSTKTETPSTVERRPTTPERSVNAPYLHLLGQIELQHVDRRELVPGRGIELLAYLLHHRQPVAGAQIQKALWPTSYDRTNGNARSLAKQVRAALGHDSNGHLWLPEGRGNAGFTTHPAMRSDWQDFLHLTGPDPRTASTRHLATALRLVHGQPLLGTDGHRGRWAWRAPLEETIIATIQDVASVAAARAIEEDDRALVKLTIRAARFADPFSELSWQIELRAATRSAIPAEVERIVADLYTTAGHGNPDYEPDTETITLIRAARSPTGNARR